MEEKNVNETSKVVVVETIEGSSLKEESPKEKYHSFKAFSRVSSIVYSFITTMLMGVLFGYLFNKWFDNDNFMVIMIVIFSFIAIYNFYRGLLRLK